MADEKINAVLREIIDLAGPIGGLVSFRSTDGIAHLMLARLIVETQEVARLLAVLVEPPHPSEGTQEGGR